MDFLDIISPNQGVWLFEQWIPRARLGLHLRLSRILERITYEDVQDTSQAIKEYLKLAEMDTSVLTGLKQLRALLVLSELNRLQTTLAFLEWNGPEDTKEPPYTYPSRAWALWVHKLASRYGWGRVEIFNLWPEEAATYIQEIMLAEYDEADERRGLTELGYKYDKTTKKSRFIPLPRPGWMMEKPNELPKKMRIRRDRLPVGNIINLTSKTDEDFH